MKDSGILSNGARLVWRHQRLVWWIFFVGIALSWLGSLPARVGFSRLLDHSLAGQRLVQTFDVPSFLELMTQPEISMGAYISASLGQALVFLVYMLFISGGIVSVYIQDRKLTRAEFSEQSGGYFWRMVRLMLISLIPYGILFSIFSAANSWSDKLSEDAVNDKTGFWVLLIAAIVLLLLGTFVRAWFDLARTRAIMNNQRGMFRNALRSFRMVSVRLYLSYIVIAIVGGAVFAGGILCWYHIPHAATSLTFILLEVMMIVQIAVRLWQRATCASWALTCDAPVVVGVIPVPAPVAGAVAAEPPPADEPGN